MNDRIYSSHLMMFGYFHLYMPGGFFFTGYGCGEVFFLSWALAKELNVIKANNTIIFIKLSNPVNK